jgi:hypothetical protein
MWEINGGQNEYIATLAIDGAGDSHVFELLLVLLVDNFKIIACRFLVTEWLIIMWSTQAQDGKPRLTLGQILDRSDISIPMGSNPFPHREKHRPDRYSY